MGELHLSKKARAEIHAAARFYLDQNPRAAARFIEAVDDTLSLLARMPRLWPVHDHGARRALVRRFPYWIYYRETQGEVHVIAVVHTHRRADAWRRQVESADDTD